MKPRYQITAVYDPKARLWAGCVLIDGENHGCVAHGKTADEAIARVKLYHPEMPTA